MTVTISREELQKKIENEDDFILVETLAPENYRHTHLPNAINIPPDRLAQLTPEMLPDKSADIVVYCAGPN
jgi:rhodanese-related sulfurtransferase